MLIEAKNDGGGGDNWSYFSFKAPVKSSSPTNQHHCVQLTIIRRRLDIKNAKTNAVKIFFGTRHSCTFEILQMTTTEASTATIDAEAY